MHKLARMVEQNNQVGTLVWTQIVALQIHTQLSPTKVMDFSL